jgi:hypothetical protein
MEHDQPPTARPTDLGFTHRRRKNGDVQILHRGKLATTLRGSDAEDFAAEIESGDHTDGQQLMARITGNYKHGNERVAGDHARNKR